MLLMANLHRSDVFGTYCGPYSRNTCWQASLLAIILLPATKPRAIRGVSRSAHSPEQLSRGAAATATPRLIRECEPQGGDGLARAARSIVVITEPERELALEGEQPQPGECDPAEQLNAARSDLLDLAPSRCAGLRRGSSARACPQ